MPDMSASASLAMTHLVPLAKEVDQNKVTPGVLGFIVFAVMALAVWGLMKSMNKHMRKVDFEEKSQDGTPSSDASSSGTPSSGPVAAGTAASAKAPGGKASPAKG
ncbi:MULTISPECIES: hypothetical protein [Streptomyces]|uniref:Membrane protein n=3 Tax=Streptomyces avermitilis TaxID=33903 RepID=Q82I60_STRAW|nr:MULTISPECIES: hypothetical protein [Streptomyces]MYS98898.1 hypothetical protein [Streptomyces sp. SID5469]OOV32779.1 hypothetical protein SM007_08270 [Streptomyces avermitilis]BAC71009.1 putative membrane protein [Streptomyces avermitilis MA-4680 = NBRC 14893]BBJ51174.1 hypothetical protein SAVMC3_38030 [Streptomyces avermitilis]GDY76655.1 hypothetical protein SAV31267_061400 [Streptomyces avermitilis]